MTENAKRLTLAEEMMLLLLDDEEQRGVIGGGPVFPVDRAESSAWLEGCHEAKISSVSRAQPERGKW